MKASKIKERPEQVQRVYKILPERLYQIRRERKLTQLEVEQGTGISMCCVSVYENGVKYPKFDNLIRLAVFYGVSVGWLLGETDRKNTEEKHD